MGPSANAGCAVRRIEWLARSLTAFFLASVLLAFGGSTATLAAAKGEQDGSNEPATICPLIYGALYCSEIPLRAAPKEIAIRRRHWPASFLWDLRPMPAYAVGVSIAAM